MNTNKSVSENHSQSPTATPTPADSSCSVNLERRSIIRKLAIGSAAVAGASALPDKWVTPLLEFGSLPAHAATSNTIELIEREIDKIINERETETTPSVEPATEPPPEEQQPAAPEPAPEPEPEPEPEPKPEPTDDLRGYTNKLVMPYTGARMSCDKVLQDKIVFPKLGPQYGSSMLLVWSDGNELTVPDSSRMIMKGAQDDYRKYQPGGQYSGNNPDIPTMEVYAKRGTHPGSVTLYYK